MQYITRSDCFSRHEMGFHCARPLFNDHQHLPNLSTGYGCSLKRRARLRPGNCVIFLVILIEKGRGRSDVYHGWVKQTKFTEEGGGRGDAHHACG